MDICHITRVTFTLNKRLLNDNKRLEYFTKAIGYILYIKMSSGEYTITKDFFEYNSKPLAVCVGDSVYNLLTPSTLFRRVYHLVSGDIGMVSDYFGIGRTETVIRAKMLRLERGYGLRHQVSHLLKHALGCLYRLYTKVKHSSNPR